MRKIRTIGSAVGALVAVFLTTLPAVAQNYPPQPVEETVVPKGVPKGEVAFTGTDITVLVVAVAMLLVVGLAALIVARRRAASVSQ
jgi:hypothetical protein